MTYVSVNHRNRLEYLDIDEPDTHYVDDTWAAMLGRFNRNHNTDNERQ